MGQRGRPAPEERNQHLLPALVLALAGAGLCLAAMVGFVAMVATNNLPWHPGLTIQEHYLQVGRSYSQGFVVGFFLCFFLTLGAVAVSRWWEGRKLRQLSGVRHTAHGALDGAQQAAGGHAAGE